MPFVIAPISKERDCRVWLIALLLLVVPALGHAQSPQEPLDSLYARANSLAEAGSTDAALALYGQILERDSTETEALRDRADLYAEQERYAEAAQALKQIEEIKQVLPDYVLGGRGWYLILAGNPREAREPTRRAMEKNPHVAAWPLNLGHTYALKSQPETAKFYYRKALRRLNTEKEYRELLSDFTRFAEEDRSREEMLAMKDWFQVTYLSEGVGGGPDPLALLGTWITLIVGLVSLFEKGETVMTEESRRVVRNWLLRDDLAEEGANWADSFKDLFDAIFTKNHLSWTCFSRSVIASATIITVLVLGMIGFGFTSMYQVAQGGPTGVNMGIYIGILSTIGMLVLINAVVDYVSLFQTRWVIGWMADTESPPLHFGLLALDAVLTLVLLVYGMGLFVAILGGLQGVTIWELLFQKIPSFMYHRFLAGDMLVGASLISTFFTSIWIWLYAIAGLTLQGSTSLLAGVDWMSELFDVENRPVHALGLMLAILTTAGFLLAIPFSL